jgi:hypothetical protein|tara:strand:+ start:30 stop:512 length:483 start_codon:yes stop_codon:yes gene_type:complete
MNKKILIVFCILVGGCSTDSDIKLICNCETQTIDYYEGVNITSSNLLENSVSNKIYSTPTKTIEEPCWGNRTKDVSVIFNDDKNSFLFSNFNEDKINIFNSEEINVLLTQWEGYKSFLYLDRRNLVLIDDDMGVTGPDSDFYPGLFQRIKVYQCIIDSEH